MGPIGNAGPAGSTGDTGPAGPAGSTPASATVATNQLTNRTAYGALATAGPAVTVTPLTGKVPVTPTEGITNVDNGASCFMSFVTSGAGATVLGASDTHSLSSARDRIWHGSATYFVSGLNNVATTFTAVCRTNVNNNECDFSDRSIIVQPLRTCDSVAADPSRSAGFPSVPRPRTTPVHGIARRIGKDMARIAVTGGAGYIGSHMCRQLAGCGHDVAVIDDLSSGHREALRWGTLLECSLLDAAALSRALRDARCDAVIHFAGAIAIGESVADPLKYYAINFCGSLNLLQAMREAGVPRIVFSSSAAVFGEPRQAFIDERHPIEPISPYGRGKAMVERLLRDSASAYGIDAAALRYFNAAGAEPTATIGESHAPETHLIPRLLRHAAGEPGAIEIHGDDHATPDGTCVRDYVHVDDLCTAHLAALDYLQTHPGFHAFNLGNGNGYSVHEVLAAARLVTGKPLQARVAPRRAGDPARLVACPDRARAVLGWRPATPTLEAIIETAWRWHRAPAY